MHGQTIEQAWQSFVEEVLNSPETPAANRLNRQQLRTAKRLFTAGVSVGLSETRPKAAVIVEMISLLEQAKQEDLEDARAAN